MISEKSDYQRGFEEGHADGHAVGLREGIRNFGIMFFTTAAVGIFIGWHIHRIWG